MKFSTLFASLALTLTLASGCAPDPSVHEDAKAADAGVSNFTKEQLGEFCSTGLKGQCGNGIVMYTADGTIKCIGPSPTAEVCDGKDNDCNDKVDDDPAGIGEDCTTGLEGACSPGTTVCKNGSVWCKQIIAASAYDACNADGTGNKLDDDCNGIVDDDCKKPAVCGDKVCDVGETVANCPADCQQCGDGKCTGNETAASCFADCGNKQNCDDDDDGYGSIACGGNDCNDFNANVHPGAAESCGNGIDDDCNGLVDANDASCQQQKCNNNGFCDGVETFVSCPQDCHCGNGFCDAGENQATCAVDCGAPNPVCGDKLCNGVETHASCPQDCPVNPFCGDGACNNGESQGTCPQDCGVPAGGQCTLTIRHTPALSLPGAPGYNPAGITQVTLEGDQSGILCAKQGNGDYTCNITGQCGTVGHQTVKVVANGIVYYSADMSTDATGGCFGLGAGCNKQNGTTTITSASNAIVAYSLQRNAAGQQSNKDYDNMVFTYVK